MNIQAPLNSALAVRDQFPAIPPGWHYLDSAATAQKPQAVIDAITRAYGHDYATVHRGVYERSAAMTQSFEAARAATAALIGGEEHEVVFTRGATEAINLVAQSWGLANLKAGDRILLSQSRASFEHRAVAAAGRAHRRPYRRLSADRRRPHRSRRCRGNADRAAQARRLRPCLERARLDPRCQARRRNRAQGRREAAARRVPGRAAHAGRRRRDRLRLLRLLGAQDLRADRDRRAVGAERNPRVHAALAWRRRDDRPRNL